MIIEAVIYGIIPRAKTPARENAPPTNISNKPSKLLFAPAVEASKADASTPGRVM